MPTLWVQNALRHEIYQSDGVHILTLRTASLLEFREIMYPRSGNKIEGLCYKFCICAYCVGDKPYQKSSREVPLGMNAYWCPEGC